MYTYIYIYNITHWRLSSFSMPFGIFAGALDEGSTSALAASRDELLLDPSTVVRWFGVNHIALRGPQTLIVVDPQKRTGSKCLDKDSYGSIFRCQADSFVWIHGLDKSDDPWRGFNCAPFGSWVESRHEESQPRPPVVLSSRVHHC